MKHDFPPSFRLDVTITSSQMMLSRGGQALPAGLREKIQEGIEAALFFKEIGAMHRYEAESDHLMRLQSEAYQYAP